MNLFKCLQQLCCILELLLWQRLICSFSCIPKNYWLPWSRFKKLLEAMTPVVLCSCIWGLYPSRKSVTFSLGGGTVFGIAILSFYITGLDMLCRLRLKCDGTRSENRFRLSAKRTSPFKSAGPSVQSTTDSWGVRISGSNAGYIMLRGSMKSTGYPLHSPVSPLLPLPCVTVCHHISTVVYILLWRGISYIQ